MSDDIFKQSVKVAVIDDNTEFGEGLKILLANEGVDVHTAADGPSGLEMVKQLLPDIVLLDVVMPGMDGIEVCKKIRHIPGLKGVHIAMLSGIKTERDQMSNGLEAGADDYITRPIPNRELLARLRVCIQLKRTEKVLEESEDRLSKIMLAANDGMYDWDLKTNKVYFDPRYYQMSGYDVDEFPHTLEEFQKRIHPGDVDFVMSEAKKHLKGDIDRFNVKFRFRKKSGDWQWIQEKGIIVERDEKGVPQRFVGTHRDISELKQVEETLRSNYDLLHIAGETARFGGWSVDLERNICTWSDAVVDIHEVPQGYAPPLEEGINFYAPEWQEKILQAFKDCAEKGIPYDEEMEVITKKGKRVWVRTNGRAVKDKDGKIIKVQGSFQDITDRKQVEKAIKESEERFKALHNASFGGIGIHDKGLILECNRGLSEITGYSYDELIGMDGLLLIAPESRDMVMNNILAGYEKPYEAFGLRKNKEIFPLRLESRNVPYKGKNVRTTEFRDITESKQAEEDLRISEESLREAQRLAQIGSWHYYLQTGKVKLSDEMYNITGMEKNRKAMQIESHERYYTLESWQIFTAALEKSRKTGKPYEIELEIVRKKGTNRWAVSRGEAITNEEGEVTELRGTLQDITERKIIEQDLVALKNNLELKVQEKTKELKERISELERFHDATIQREFRMKELRDEIEQLKKEKE